MSEPDRVLTTLTRTQGANQALKDGTVTPAGFSLKFEEIPVLVKGFRRMVRSLEFDVSEMALTTYLTAREHGVAFTALPVFLVRGFHHGAIRVQHPVGHPPPPRISRAAPRWREPWVHRHHRRLGPRHPHLRSTESTSGA